MHDYVEAEDIPKDCNALAKRTRCRSVHVSRPDEARTGRDNISAMIIHFSTVHVRTDTRIRLKEVPSIARALDEPVVLYVQDGLGDERDSVAGFQIIDIGPRPKGRVARMTFGAWRMYRAVRAARPKIAHFHDPELLPWAVLLRFQGIKVVYDVHEDVPAQIRSKHYLPLIVRPVAAALFNSFERMASGGLDGIVAATPAIASRFTGPSVTIVQNFALKEELYQADAVAFENRSAAFAYIGGISEIRGFWQVSKAAEFVREDGIVVILAGTFNPPALLDRTRKSPGRAGIEFAGHLAREDVANLLNRSLGGIVTFLPEENHLHAQPNKLFEYMAAGIPVIASDFPLWREIVEGAECGIMVRPEDPQAIADAMRWIAQHRTEAQAMGARGREAVLKRYNWEAASAKLVGLYQALLSTPVD